MQGEKDLTSAQLNEANPLPGAANIVSYGATKLMPFWDPLRGDPRFEVQNKSVEAAVSAAHLNLKATRLPPQEENRRLP